MSLVLIRQFRATLLQMDTWLEKAEGWAQTRKFAVDGLLTERLFPDMLPLAAQIRIACDAAKAAAARLAGKDAPRHADDETTLAALRARVRDVAAYLDTFTDADFPAEPSRHLPIPYPPGKFMEAEAYLIQRQVPNFYFHAVTTYALLRRAGVELGKADYLGSLQLFDS